jgi:hypothetical protein
MYDTEVEPAVETSSGIQNTVYSVGSINVVMCDWFIMCDETDVSEPRPSLAYCSSPGWMWVESRGDDAGWG